MKDRFSIAVINAVIILGAITIICVTFAQYMEAKTASMISGALSAFSTIVLGIIAISQNKKYNKTSGEFVEKQQVLLKNIEIINEQQKSIILQNNYYNFFTTYSTKIERLYSTFKKYSSGWADFFYSQINTLPLGKSIDVSIQFNNMVAEFSDIELVLSKDLVFFEGKAELIEVCKAYQNKITEYLGDSWVRKAHPDHGYERYAILKSETEDLYKDLIIKFEHYLFEIETYLFSILSEITTVKDIQNNIEQMARKQVAWLNQTDTPSENL